MSAGMKAVVFHGRGDIRVEERPVPEFGSNEVLIEVTAAGICGSDVGELLHGPVLISLDEPHPVTGHSGPLILGHEFAGRVVEVGAAVKLLRVGQLVASGSGVSCGVCDQCRAGRTNLCDRYWTLGFNRDGGLARMVAVPESVCLVVDETVISEDAAGMIQPVSIAVHSMRQGAPAAGSRVATVGAGGVGAFLVAALRVLADVQQITTVEPDPSRRRVASELGAHEAVGPDEVTSADYDVVYEVSGTAAGLRTALAMVRRGGRIVLVGLQKPGTHDEDLLRRVSFNEIQLVGPNAHVFATDFADAARVVGSRDDWTMIAPTFHPLTDVAEVMDRMASGGATAIKALFDPRIATARDSRFVLVGGRS